MRIFLNTEIHRIMNMNQYVKQKMNLEFGYHMEFYCEEMCGSEERDDGTIEDFKLMFDLLPAPPLVLEFVAEAVAEARTSYDEAVAWRMDLDAVDIPYYNYEYLHNTNIKIDMIKNIERNEILDVVVRPLQIKMKEMLNSPHTKRGRAFIEKQIEWAFEE